MVDTSYAKENPNQKAIPNRLLLLLGDICSIALYTCPDEITHLYSAFKRSFGNFSGRFLRTVIKLNTLKIKNTINRILALPSALAFLAGLISLFWLLRFMNTQPFNEQGFIWMSCSLIFVLSLLLSFFSTWLFWHGKSARALLTFALASILACAVLVPCAFLWFYQAKQVAINDLVGIAVGQHANVATLFSRQPSVLFALQQPVLEVQSLSQLAEFCRSGNKPHLLLATSNCLRIPELNARQHIVAQKGHWYLLNVDGYPW